MLPCQPASSAASRSTYSRHAAILCLHSRTTSSSANLNRTVGKGSEDRGHFTLPGHLTKTSSFLGGRQPVQLLDWRSELWLSQWLLQQDSLVLGILWEIRALQHELIRLEKGGNVQCHRALLWSCTTARWARYSEALTTMIKFAPRLMCRASSCEETI